MEFCLSASLITILYIIYCVHLMFDWGIIFQFQFQIENLNWLFEGPYVLLISLCTSIIISYTSIIVLYLMYVCTQAWRRPWLSLKLHHFAATTSHTQDLFRRRLTCVQKVAAASLIHVHQEGDERLMTPLFWFEVN